MDRSKKEVINGQCAFHYEQTFVFSEICKGFVCLECIKNKYFIEDIILEIKEDYPELFP